MAASSGAIFSLVAHQDEPHVRMADERQGRSRNDHARAMVTAHRVKRYGDLSTHSPTDLEDVTLQRSSRGNPRKTNPE